MCAMTKIPSFSSEPLESETNFVSRRCASQAAAKEQMQRSYIYGQICSLPLRYNAVVQEADIAALAGTFRIE